MNMLPLIYAGSFYARAGSSPAIEWHDAIFYIDISIKNGWLKK
jgi:hypothetical protein